MVVRSVFKSDTSIDLFANACPEMVTSCGHNLFFSWLSVVETILKRSEELAAKDPYLRFSGGGEELVRLVLGIYTYPASDEGLRKRAMDAFDQLMNVFTGQALMVLGEWDRR